MKNLICVDKGALKMALNILERGSDLHKQAAEALKQSCTDHIQQLEADKAEIKTAYEVGKLTIKNAMKEANELSGKVYDLEVKEIALEDKIKQLQSELAEAREANRWIPVSERLPEKPNKESYEYVDCYIFYKGKILERPWNCEHLCWDDEHYDDFFCEALAPTHWMKKQEITKPE